MYLRFHHVFNGGEHVGDVRSSHILWTDIAVLETHFKAFLTHWIEEARLREGDILHIAQVEFRLGRQEIEGEDEHGLEPPTVSLGDMALPQQFVEGARELPELTIIIAHLGVCWGEEAATLCRIHPNIYADLSGHVKGWRSSKKIEWFEEKLWSILPVT